MTFDSQEQKDFIIKAVLAFQCDVQTALTFTSKYGESIQKGEVVPCPTSAEKEDASE